MTMPALSPPGSPTGLIKRDPWQTGKLGGDVIPGACKVISGQVHLKEDKKPKAGADGANPAFHGLDLGKFELELTQHTDEEREALRQLCAQILPQPGQSATQYPLQLQHPSVAHFGFGIFVKVLGGSTLEVVGAGTTRMRVFLRHWLRPRQGVNATAVYTRGTKNAIRDKREQEKPSNPLPTEQPGIASPPANFTPAS
jgi:hypothetical protein